MLAGAPRHDDLAGRVLGDFVVTGPLAGGDVWSADQPGLGRDAVIKVLRGGDEARTRRFLREAQLASRLDHPYAAHVYAFGAEDDGLLWIAMERVHGASLAELVERQGPLPVARLAPLFERLCEVVQTAHDAGIVHRDLKPANVMVVVRAGRLLPKLLDLGIARARIPGEAPERPGDVVGSPAFMAPEQWFDPGGVDHRADVYALGALAYVALTGRLPFVGATAREQARAHASTPPPPLGDGVPAALDAVLGRALAKRPDDRFASALALGAALRAVVASDVAPELPSLPSAVHDAMLSAAPPPVADALAGLDAARDEAAARVAARAALSAVVRWLAVLALAGQRGRAPDAALIAALAPLRRGGLDDAGWLELARAAIAGVPAALLPVPGLAAALAALPAQVPDELPALLAALERALRGAPCLVEYSVVVRRGDRVERWAGTRRRRRPAAWLRDGAVLDDGSPVLVDGDGAVVLALAPLAVVTAPAPGAEPELFVLDRGEPGGAVLVTFPDGFEHRDDPWPALGLVAGDAGGGDDERCAYRGLEPFGPGDAADFVGREVEADAAANRLRTHGLLVVVGPSGAGKSSFVLAGVVPRLSGIRTSSLRPGLRPRDALATALAAGPELLVVDQLEELVTVCADEPQRAGFASGLLAYLDGGGRAALTVRDDFLLRVAAIGELRTRLEPALQLLATPPPDALVRIVVEPARRAGYVFDDPALPAAMVDAVVGRPGALPLLSFAAARLWRERDVRLRQLTRRAHDAIGGVVGALAGHAEAVLAALPGQERAVRDVFRVLATAEGTRAVASRGELAQVAGAGVIDALVDARLLVTTDDDGADRVELVHEALLAAWPRLAAWRRDDAETARLRDALRTAARAWDERGRGRGLLWRGDALDEYRLWRSRFPGALTGREEAFAAASLADARRGRRLRRGAVAAVIAGLALAAALLTVANRDARRARQAADGRAIELLIEQGRTAVLGGQPMQGLVWLDEAYRQGARPADVAPLAAGAARQLDQRRAAFIGHGSRITTAALSPDGRWLVSGSGARDGTVRIWELATGAEVGRVAVEGNTIDIDVAPDGATAALAGEDGRVRIVALPDGRSLRTVELGAAVTTVRHDGAGRLVAALFDGSLVVVDGDAVRRWPVGTGRLAVAVLPDGSLLTAGMHGALARWSVDGRALQTLGATRPSVVLSADAGGRRAALIGFGDPVVPLWDLASGRLLAQLDADGIAANVATFSPDGAWLATAGHDGTIRLWETATGRLAALLADHRGPVYVVAFSPDGAWLASAGDDHAVRLWDLPSRRVAARLHHHVGRVEHLHFTAAGDRLVSGGLDGTLAVWAVGPTGLVATVRTGGGEGADVRWLPDGTRIEAGLAWPARRVGADGAVLATYVDPGGPALPRPARTAVGVVRRPDLDRDRRRLVAPGRAGALVWDVASAAVVATCPVDGTPVTAVAMRPDGTGVAIGGDDGRVALCTPGGAPLRELGRHRRSVRGLAFSPDGTRLVSVADDPDSILWDAGSGRPLATLRGHTSIVGDVAFAPDGRHFATAALDNSVRLWTLDGAPAGTLVADAGLDVVAFRADGALIAAGREDGGVTVWHLATRRRVADVGAHGAAVTGLTFGPDGRSVMAATADHLHTWSVADDGGDPAAVAARVGCLPYALVDGDLRPRPFPPCAPPAGAAHHVR
jgi:WD40 repeat protein